MGKKRYYIDETAENALLNYKYHGADYSILSRLFTPMWNFICQLLPEWMAPNLVTFISFCCSGLAFVMCMLTHPNFDMDTSAWYYPYMFILFSILIWIYQTLDAVDGKQARRTGSSSPLGELFDHGCDSLNSVFQVSIGVCMFGYGNSSASFITFFIVGLVTHMCLFEEYTTLCLRFGKFNSVTEILTLFELLLAFTGITRGWFWREIELGFLSNIIGEKVTFGWLLALSGFLIAPLNIYEAFKYTIEELNNKTEQSQERGLTLFGCTIGLVSGALTCIIYAAWFLMDFEFYQNHVALFCLSFGVQMSYLSTRMIIHRVCKQKMKPFYLVLVPSMIGFVLCNFVLVDNPLHKLMTFWGMLGVIILIYTHFVYHVIFEILDVLEIHLFTLGKRKKDI